MKGKSEKVIELKAKIKTQEAIVQKLANEAMTVEGNKIIIHKKKKQEYVKELQKLYELTDELDDIFETAREPKIGHRYSCFAILDLLHTPPPRINGKAKYARILIQKAYEFELQIMDGELVQVVYPNPEYKGNLNNIITITECSRE